MKILGKYFYVLLTLCALALLAASCARSGGDATTDAVSGNRKAQRQALLAPGVSRELARLRKTQLSELHYGLDFVLPEAQDQAVTGRVEISFRREASRRLFRPLPLVLDFRARPEQVKAVQANGREVPYRLCNEHIVIEAKHLPPGPNTVAVDFVAGDRSLNRNPDFLYTLSVPDRARTLYPCFDQPDMKARFSLRLTVPPTWEALSNAPLREGTSGTESKVLVFEPTQPLSTYLFAFTAGKWQKMSQTREGRCATMYYRETDPYKLAQSPAIFDYVFRSLQWMEDYTGVALPFPKYDFAVVPGFQFGGMEHPGAILYNDKRIFLGQNPTVEEELRRHELIAHETAHLWFGDAVTMAWFDDVWTKEVFAGYLASLMTGSQAPTDKPSPAEAEARLLQDLRSFYVSAYAEDRTPGSNPIRQTLPNLKDAGLVYGNIIYNKAPIVMGYLVKLLGEEAFRDGVREYVRTYLYGNATWDDLIRILDARTPEDLQAWSRAWVSERGMPLLSATWQAGKLTLRQEDPLGRGLCWPQDVDLSLCKGSRRLKTLHVHIEGPETVIDCTDLLPELQATQPLMLPNLPGGAYGYFVYDAPTTEALLSHFPDFGFSPAERMAVLINLNENRLHKNLDPRAFAHLLLENLRTETEPLIQALSLSYLKDLALHGPTAGDPRIEECLWELTQAYPALSQQAFRSLLDLFRQPQITQALYAIWKDQAPCPGLKLNEADYMKLAYELALRLPERYTEIRSVQAARLSNPDRLREFHYVARALVPEAASRDSLFASLAQAQNRQIEPWTAQVMGYLNHPLRQEEALPYLDPALALLEEIQSTGDIFFPKDWISAALRGHNSPQARHIVTQFLAARPHYPPLLRNKILQSAAHLMQE